MTTLLILRNVATQLLRQPLFWLVSASLVACWWGLEVFMPLGLSTEQLHRSTAHYELAFLGGALAMGLAMGPCIRMRWTLRDLGPWRGVGVDLITLMLAATMAGSVVLIPAEAFQLWQFPEFRTPVALAGLALGWLHLASMAAVIPLRITGASPGREAQASFRDRITGLGWIAFAVVAVPALVPGLSPHGRALLHLLDPGRMLRASFSDAEIGVGTWLAAWIPPIGWALVAVGLGLRADAPSQSPLSTPHALRDPR